MSMRILDLCAGTQSIKRALSKKHEIISVDIDQKTNPSICTDILQWDYKKSFPKGYFDVIWASPPCTEYSSAKSIGVRNLKLADTIVKRCLSIIDYLQPRKWFLENPGGAGLLHKRPFMKKLNKFKNGCCYCKYGHPFRKRTDIWSNQTLILEMCYASTPCTFLKKYGKHIHWIDGKTTFHKRNQIPPKLLRRLILY